MIDTYFLYLEERLADTLYLQCIWIHEEWIQSVLYLLYLEQRLIQRIYNVSVRSQRVFII